MYIMHISQIKLIGIGGKPGFADSWKVTGWWRYSRKYLNIVKIRMQSIVWSFSHNNFYYSNVSSTECGPSHDEPSRGLDG